MTCVNRHYACCDKQIAEDSFWKDPPGIFDKVVWPAYVQAHSHLFEEGDVEWGSLTLEPWTAALKEQDQEQEQPQHSTTTSSMTRPTLKPAKDVVLLEEGELSMQEIFDKACEVIYRHAANMV